MAHATRATEWNVIPSPSHRSFSDMRFIWTRNQGGPAAHPPAEDPQLRTHVSRESETTTPSLDARTSSTPTLSPAPLHHSLRQLNDEALSDFFGGRGHRTRTRHRAPSPYSPEWDSEKLPEFASSDSELDTVARYLFKYGFFFPVFWAIGVYFLFAPMRVSADWQPDKTEEEKAKMLSEMRKTEVKWAKRCLWALLSLFLCLVILIVAVVLSRH